jgi:predicted ATPase with chaperone activity
VVSMNPCPCGFYGDIQNRVPLHRHWSRSIKSEFLGRCWIEIQIEMPRVDYEELSGDRVRESSEAIGKRARRRGLFKISVSSKMFQQISSVMPTCASGRSASFAKWETMVSD